MTLRFGAPALRRRCSSPRGHRQVLGRSRAGWEFSTASREPNSRSRDFQWSARGKCRALALSAHQQPKTLQAHRLIGRNTRAASGSVAVARETHIKPLFRARDRQPMKCALHPWSYDDVSQPAGTASPRACVTERCRATARGRRRRSRASSGGCNQERRNRLQHVSHDRWRG